VIEKRQGEGTRPNVGVRSDASLTKEGSSFMGGTKSPSSCSGNNCGVSSNLNEKNIPHGEREEVRHKDDT